MRAELCVIFSGEFILPSFSASLLCMPSSIYYAIRPIIPSHMSLELFVCSSTSEKELHQIVFLF